MNATNTNRIKVGDRITIKAIRQFTDSLLPAASSLKIGIIGDVANPAGITRMRVAVINITDGPDGKVRYTIEKGGRRHEVDADELAELRDLNSTH